MNQDNRKILVLDDDDITRKVISYALKKNNYEVIETDNPDKAFDILKTDDISLVFCDVRIGRISGFDFCKSVRGQEKNSSLPFVFLTPNKNVEDSARVLELGADDFLIKPFNADDLLIKVNSILKRTEIHRVYGLKKKFEESEDIKSAKILLVDDDPVSAELFRYALNGSGFDCRVEHNAMDGLESARTYLPDIILSDFMMPEIDGFEFRKLLLNDPLLKDIPFVFITANDSENVILDGYDLDIKDFILKTASPRLVTVKVTNIIKNLKKERQVALKELQEAADSISMELVPSEKLDFKGYSVKHWYKAYEGIPGGDFIDYISINDNKFVVILGDIMGKKWGAWFFTFSFIGYIRSAIRVALKNFPDITAADILSKVNEIIYCDAKISEIFSAISVVLIDSEKNIAQYAGAGDLPPLYFNSVPGDIIKINSQGLLLGLNNESSYENYEINMNKGDFIMLYTDGIIESRNGVGEQYGLNRLQKAAGNSKSDSLEYIKKDFVNFTVNRFEDDVSIVCIKRKL
ncbi:MAG: response regulator, partial [Ignavibacteria bacterium]|nr:response regulator [Ignavibacteria bacterium]